VQTPLAEPEPEAPDRCDADHKLELGFDDL